MNCTVTKVAVGVVVLFSFSTALLGSSLPASALEPQAPSILELRQQGNLKAAIALQLDTIKRESERGANTTNLNLATHHFNLGVLYHEDRNYRKAIKPLSKGIDLIRQAGQAHDARLIDALGHLGIVYLKLGRMQQAIDRFQEAQNIIHRNDGVLSLRQEKMLDWLSVAHIKRGKLKLANTLQEFRYTLYREEFGEGHPETVPALLRLGEWYQSSAQYTQATDIYTKAAEIAETHHRPAREVRDSHTGLAYTSYLDGVCCADEHLLAAAQAVIEDESFDNLERGRAVIAAADMRLVLGRAGPELYREAWVFGGDRYNEDYEKPSILGISRVDRMVRAYRDSDFDVVHYINNPVENDPEPVEMVGAPLTVCAAEMKELSRNRNYSNYVIDLDFQVTAEGRAKDVRVIESNAPRAVNRLIRNLLKLYRFRPKLHDGEPIDDTMMVRQTFDNRVNNSEQPDFPPANLATMHGCHLLAAN